MTEQPATIAGVGPGPAGRPGEARGRATPASGEGADRPAAAGGPRPASPPGESAASAPRPGRGSAARAGSGTRGGSGRARGPGAPSPLAAELPVARVAVDTPLTHLDRPFDYLVPADLAAAAVPGSRVRVRFAGRQVDGFVLERRAVSEHPGRLAPLERSVSPEPVLSDSIARLARAVADRYAGTLADVLRLAVPPRHGRTESAPSPPEESPSRPATAAGVSEEASPPPEAAATTSEPVAPRPEVAAAPESTQPSVPTPVRMTPGAAPSAPADGAAHDGRPAEWARYPAGPSMLAALAAGRSPRAVWWAPPGPAWPAMIATAVGATVRSGRGAVVVVPDHRDVDRVEAALVEVIGRETTVALRADLGPSRRYRAFLAASRGQARVVVGTRSAVFAPVADLGLLVVWDDGDELHAEPLAPYPHTRDVAMLRARQDGCALLIGGFCPTTEAEALVRSGWAHPLVLPLPEVRALAPRVEATGSDHEYARDPAARAARLPSLAVRTARQALAAGAPVLVQVPRRGYQPSLACADCRRPARCRHCQGPLGRSSGAGVLSCQWCGRPVPAAPGALGAAPAPEPRAPEPRAVAAAGGAAGVAVWRCPSCSSPRLRASVTGDRRTAEELGRAFPDVPVRTSGRDGVLAAVPAEPALVISTPGAEPVAVGGYGAVLLLDGWALLGRPDLRAAETTLRRWAAAAALARPAPRGGRVIVSADAGLPVVQALVRWDPATFAAREADERAELGFPPATRMATVEGSAAAVAELLAVTRLPEGADLLGPVPLPPAPRARAAATPGGGPASVGGPGAGEGGEIERLLIRVPRERGAALAAALHEARGVLGARRSTAGLRVQLDPLVIG
ncbi:MULTISPECIES: primosomal protein N' [Frankia]|uniref:primosomal protein N' n=1 Tax=Frankia TaxID=1854 RepID=UPI000BA2DFE2|nr:MULTISPECIES: primosomal protein N' [Frankia]